VDIPSQMRIVAPTVATDVVLSNLIGNALRHGGGTPIFIGGRGRTISVRNGRRMDDQNRAQRPGIGLNLVRRLCVACGFDLSVVTSEIGTTAEISFPKESISGRIL
jgi:signal transduction histidine kinase